jgi:segregation and condensation protein B
MNDDEKPTDEKKETFLRIVPPQPKSPQPIKEEGPQSSFPFTEEPHSNTIEAASIIEAVLFAADKPLNRPAIREALGGNYSNAEIDGAIELLQKRHSPPWGLRLTEVAAGYQLRTAPEHRNFVTASLRIKPQRLSKAALETLAIVAYRQPLTRAEIDEIRGVDSGGALKNLLDRSFLRILGRKEEPGRPVLYGTSRDFLEFFGLKDLQSLPSLSEIRSLNEEERALDISRPEEEAFTDETFASRKPGEVPADIVDSLAKAMAEIDRVTQSLPLDTQPPTDGTKPPEPTSQS